VTLEPSVCEAGTRHTLVIRALAAGGAGIGELPDGRVVFIQGALPGDEVDATIVRSKKRWAAARLEGVITEGAGRRAAACRHFQTCGGCAFLNLDYGEQLRWKATFVKDALQRLAGVEIPLPEVEGSPLEFHYRNRMAFALRRLRGGRVVAGLHELHRPSRVMDVGKECLLPDPVVGAAWQALRDAWGPGARHLPAGGDLRLTLRSVGEEWTLLVDGGEGAWDPRPLVERLPGVSSVWHHPRGAGVPMLVHGAAEVEAPWMDRTVPLGARSFLQVNAALASSMVDHVVRITESHLEGVREGAASASLRVVDAYCGVGGYGRAVAGRDVAVVGIEADEGACRAAAHGAPDTFQVRRGRVEDHLPDALPAEVVIVNPPRTGLDPLVTEALVADPPGCIVYVSCDPATLARDVERLGAVFDVGEARSFDLFPQTPHVETVIRLNRRAAG